MRSIIYLLCFAFLFCAFNPGDSRVKVKATYDSQIGVGELTGRNDGIEVETYLKSVNRKKGDAWCAAFVNWCLEVNCMKRAESGWSPSWFPAKRTIYIRGKYQKATPQAGDVMGIYFQNMGRIAHVGFIDKWGSSYVYTVEGNTGPANSGQATREGDGVYRKKRLTRQVYAVSNWIE